MKLNLLFLIFSLTGIVAVVRTQEVPFCTDSNSNIADYIPAGSTYNKNVALGAGSPYRLQCPPGLLIVYQGTATQTPGAQWSVDNTTGMVTFQSNVNATGVVFYMVVMAYCGTFDVPLCRTNFVLGMYTPVTTGAPFVPSAGDATNSSAVTDAPSTPVDRCVPVYGFDVYIGSPFQSTLSDFEGASQCNNSQSDTNTTTITVAPKFQLLQGPVYDGKFVLGADGQFTYNPPDQQGFDRFQFAIVCEVTQQNKLNAQAVQSTSSTLCSATAYLTISRSPPVDIMATTTTPVPIAPQVQICPLAFTYDVRGPNPGLDLTLMSNDAQQRCNSSLGFTATYTLFEDNTGYIGDEFSSNNETAQKQSRLILFNSNGSFVYVPSRQSSWSNFTFTFQCFSPDQMLYFVCRGTALILTRGSATGVTAPPKPVFVATPQLSCQGTCNQDAWKVLPFFADVWDNTLDENNSTLHSPPRADLKPVDGVQIAIIGSATRRILITAFGKIGTTAARYPTFERLFPPSSSAGTNPPKQLLDPTFLTQSLGNNTVPFNLSCFSQQPFYGASEQVWWWDDIVSKRGHVGEAYASGHSFYQKFGGKHLQCDTFANPCRFAPFLTPATKDGAVDASSLWKLSVAGCDTTWSVSYRLQDLASITFANGTPVWQRIPSSASSTSSLAIGGSYGAILYNEAMKPRSGSRPSVGVLTADTAYLLAVDTAQVLTWFSSPVQATGSTTTSTTAAPKDNTTTTTQSSPTLFVLDQLESQYSAATSSIVYKAYLLATTAAAADKVTVSRVSVQKQSLTMGSLCAPYCSGSNASLTVRFLTKNETGDLLYVKNSNSLLTKSLSGVFPTVRTGASGQKEGVVIVFSIQVPPIPNSSLPSVIPEGSLFIDLFSQSRVRGAQTSRFQFTIKQEILTVSATNGVSTLPNFANFTVDSGSGAGSTSDAPNLYVCRDEHWPIYTDSDVFPPTPCNQTSGLVTPVGGMHYVVVRIVLPTSSSSPSSSGPMALVPPTTTTSIPSSSSSSGNSATTTTITAAQQPMQTLNGSTTTPAPIRRQAGWQQKRRQNTPVAYDDDGFPIDNSTAGTSSGSSSSFQLLRATLTAFDGMGRPTSPRISLYSAADPTTDLDWTMYANFVYFRKLETTSTPGQNYDISLGFSPAPLCANQSESCSVILEAVVKVNGKKRGLQQTFQLQPSFEFATTPSYYSVMVFEDGQLPSLPVMDVHHAATMTISISLIGLLMLVGAAFLYYDDSAREVITDHGKSMQKFLTKHVHLSAIPAFLTAFIPGGDKKQPPEGKKTTATVSGAAPAAAPGASSVLKSAPSTAEHANVLLRDHGKLAVSSSVTGVRDRQAALREAASRSPVVVAGGASSPTVRISEQKRLQDDEIEEEAKLGKLHGESQRKAVHDDEETVL